MACAPQDGMGWWAAAVRRSERSCGGCLDLDLLHRISRGGSTSSQDFLGRLPKAELKRGIGSTMIACPLHSSHHGSSRRPTHHVDFHTAPLLLRSASSAGPEWRRRRLGRRASHATAAVSMGEPGAGRAASVQVRRGWWSADIVGVGWPGTPSRRVALMNPRHLMGNAPLLPGGLIPHLSPHLSCTQRWFIYAGLALRRRNCRRSRRRSCGCRLSMDGRPFPHVRCTEVSLLVRTSLFGLPLRSPWRHPMSVLSGCDGSGRRSTMVKEFCFPRAWTKNEGQSG